MKATFRSSAAAAAMLLGSLGAMLVSTPAAAQFHYRYGYEQPAVVAQPDFRGRYGYVQPAVVAQPDFRGDHQRWDGRGRHFRRDDRGPWISDLTASQGGRGRTRLATRVGDHGSGVDLASLVLRVDGHDVTRHARVDGDDIRYAEFMHPGRHVAELTVRDRAGNISRRSWAFDVPEHGRNYGYYDGR